MSGLRTNILFAIVMLLPQQAASSGELHTIFAGCAGRFSAEMEHAWLMRDSTADELDGRRQTFLSLMEATMPPDSARDMLHYRLDHKLAHASLLTLATFGQDERRARNARLTANAYRLDCERLLLEG